MDMQFIKPKLYARRVTNRPEQLGGETGIANGANVFVDHVFVVKTAGILDVLASAAVLSCGLCLDASKASAVIDPPYALRGDRHYPVALQAQRFAVSVTDATGHYGESNGAPQLSEITVGSSYHILKLANGNHALNVDGTSTPFFTVVEKPSQWQGTAQDADTYNPVVIVEVIASCVQSI